MGTHDNSCRSLFRQSKYKTRGFVLIRQMRRVTERHATELAFDPTFICPPRPGDLYVPQKMIFVFLVDFLVEYRPREMQVTRHHKGHDEVVGIVEIQRFPSAPGHLVRVATSP